MYGLSAGSNMGESGRRDEVAFGPGTENVRGGQSGTSEKELNEPTVRRIYRTLHKIYGEMRYIWRCWRREGRGERGRGQYVARSHQ